VVNSPPILSHALSHGFVGGHAVMALETAVVNGQLSWKHGGVLMARPLHYLLKVLVDGCEWLERCGCRQQREAVRKMRSFLENGRHRLTHRKKLLGNVRLAPSSGRRTHAGTSRDRLPRLLRVSEA